MRAIYFLTLPFLLLVSPSAGIAASLLPAGLVSGYRRDVGPWGTVYYRGREWTEADRSRAADAVSGGLKRVEARIGRSRGRPFTVVLTPDQREFARIFKALTSRRPRRWIAGVAFPSRDLLLVAGDSLSVLKRPADRPSAVLEHEIAHLVIHARRGARIPRWFDEGVAMWAAHQSLLPGDEAFLSGLARIGALYRLEALDEEIPRTQDLASIAYQQSFLVVEWLALSQGPSVIGDLLELLQNGTAFPEALERRTGYTISDLEKRFFRWLKSKRSFLEVVASVVNLWTLVTLLALVAIARAVIRRRRLLRKMEEEEGADPLEQYS